MDHGELVRSLTDDYFHRSAEGRDAHGEDHQAGERRESQPDREVGVTVTGEDDFPLQELDLHYSVQRRALKN